MKRSQDLLAQKIALESKWNQAFLEAGKVTNEMQETSHEIKSIVKELISIEMEEVINNANNYETHAFAG